jgi:hypothetical protein
VERATGTEPASTAPARMRWMRRTTNPVTSAPGSHGPPDSAVGMTRPAWRLLVDEPTPLHAAHKTDLTTVSV